MGWEKGGRSRIALFPLCWRFVWTFSSFSVVPIKKEQAGGENKGESESERMSLRVQWRA